MNIKEVMIKPVFVSPDTSKKELLKIARRNKQAHLFVVVGKNKKFLGDIHENDLFYMVLPNQHYESIGIELAFDLEKKFFAKTARELMRKHDVKCTTSEDIERVALRFAQEEVNEIPVVNEKGQVVGVITQGILMRHLK